MSIPKISGRQARDLLIGTTPGPWKSDFAFADISPVLEYDADDELDWSTKADHELAVAAPALAETVAWLYGAEGQDGHYGKRRWPLGTRWEVALWRGLISIGPEGGGIAFRTPELAEEAARALLAAAEEARDE